MNGVRVLQVAFCSVLAAAGLLGSGRGVAAEGASGAGRTGKQGRALDGQLVNVAELAASQAGAGLVKSAKVQRRSGPVRSREANGIAGGAVIADSTGSGLTIAASSEVVLSAASAPPSPPVSASFVALLDNAVAFNPDTQGAVGPNHLMVTLGSEVRIQNRSGGVISTVSLDGFWGSLGSSNVFDPRVIYDRANGRWIAAAVSNPATSNSLVLLAISQSNDPTGNWHRQGVRVDDVDGVYASSPSIGLSRDWITIQANMLDQTGLFYFSSDIFTFSKTNLYAGGSAQAYRRFYHFPFQAGAPPGMSKEAATPTPMVSMDDSSPTNFLVANAGVLGGLGRLRLFTISGPVDDPLFNDFEPGFFVGAGQAFGNPTWVSVPPGNDNFAPQVGSTNKIYVGDARIQNVVFRNGALWATHHVYLPTNNPNRVSVQWWSLTPGGSVLQQGRMDDASGGKMFAFPSIAVNRYEDVLIGYSRFALNQFPSANYAFHGYQDGPGRLQGDTVLKAGESKFAVADDGLVLWGDWSASVCDPLNDTDMWTIQEYASSPVASIERWGTWWGRVSPPTSLGLLAVGPAGPLVAGSEVSYSIHVTNFSSHLATGVRISNVLPAGASFVSAAVSQGACGFTNGVVVCVVGDVQGVLSNSVVVSVSIVARLNQAGSATNSVSVAGFSPDEWAPDNSAVVTTAVAAAADVALGLVASPNPVVLSNTISYVVSVTNRGPSAAGACGLTNVLPTGVTFVSVSTSVGSCSQVGGTVSCALGSLNAGVGGTVTILARATVVGPQTNVVVVSSSSMDPNLANNSATSVTVGNTLPSLQAISNRAISEDGTLGPIAFTVGDAETPLDGLVLGAFSSNPAVVPPGNILLSGSGANRFLTVSPAPNASGSVTITRTVTDGAGSVVSNAFVLTISAVNDAPTISDVASQLMNEDIVLGPLAFTIGDVETVATGLTLSAASSNPALIPNANIQFGGSGSSRTVRIVPATNQSGSATITLTVSDGVVTASDSFVVTVNAVNDAPTITDVGNRTILEDSSTPAIVFTIGDVETPLAALVVSATSSNPILVPNGNVVFTGTGVGRSVVVTPAANQFGVATITILVTDTNGAAASDAFVLTVSPVNDAPTLDVLAPLALLEDAGPQIVRMTGISTGASNELTSLSITASSSNPALIPSPGVIPHFGSATTNSFVIVPTTNMSGTATITVVVNDGAGSNNVVVRSFVVSVSAVNDLPTITGLADRTINEDGTTGALPFVVGDVESTPGSLVVSGASSNTNLVPVSNIVFGGSGSNRTMSVTPAPDQFGIATITVLVRDASATNIATFLLTVNSVNDLPTISSITNRTVDEDVSTSLSFTIGDKETGAGSLIVSARSSNPQLIPAFSFDGTGSNRTVNVVPATNQSGSANITVTVRDGDAGSNSTTFALSVLPVNDLPTLDVIADVTIDEDSPLQSIVLMGISAGAPNEVQPVAVTVVSLSANILTNVVASYGSGDSTGRVEFLPVRNASGTAVVTVRVSDGISTNSRSFTVTVRAVNDLPTISQLNTIAIDEDTTAVVPVFVSDLETPASGLLLRVESSNLEVLDEGGIVIEGSGTNRLIRLTPIADVFGDDTIVSVTVVDGDNGSATTTFTLNVRSVNDAPTISAPAVITVDEDSMTNLVSFVVADAESLPSSLLVSVSSANSTLLPPVNLVLGVSGASRTLMLTPAPNEFGTTTVSIVVFENSGIGALAVTNVVTVVVLPLNDPPTLDPIQAMLVPSGSAGRSVNLSGIGMGAGNEGQSLRITALSGDVAVIPHPSISYISPAAVGTLFFTPVSGAIGSVSIAVTVSESGGVLFGGANQITRTFLVNVTGPGPALVVEQLNGRAIISWPTNGPIAWRLESTTNVSERASWVASPALPAIANGRYTVTNVVDGVSRFYRLRNE